VGSADTPSSAVDVHVSGNYAYVTDLDSGLQVINISDPTSPTIVGSADTPSGAGSVHITGNYAYVASTELHVIEISNPINPTIVGSADTPGWANGVHVTGNYAYVSVGSGLQVLSVFKPCTNITFVDSTTLTATVPAGLPPGPHNLHVTNPNPERAILYNAFIVTEGNGDGGGGGGFG